MSSGNIERPEILDRIRGALVGHCLGDCIGASYEFFIW